MRVYLDLPDDIVEKAHTLALREDRFPKQQMERLMRLAIEAAFHAIPTATEDIEASYAPAHAE